MKKILLILCIAFTYFSQAQFIEMGPYNNETIEVSVMGKDGNGMLYASGSGGIYRKADVLTDSWQYVSGPAGVLAMCEVNGYKMYNHFSTQVFSSTNGLDWSPETLPGGSSNVVFMQYLDNENLIVCKDDKTLISTNGGASFQDFLNTPILSIAWDHLNSRYVYSTNSGLYAKTSIAASPTVLYTGAVHDVPLFGNYGYLMCINNDGVVYTTEKSSFPFIKKIDPVTSTLTNIYPAAGAYPIHARGLFATKTGRVYCIGWSNAGAFLIADDAPNNYRTSIPQGGYNSYFLDRAGYLYLNADANGAGIQEHYSKSAYSVRQPVFFKRMNSIMDEGFYGFGFTVRATTDSLVSIDFKGRVFASIDNGEIWDSISQVPNISVVFPLEQVYHHPAGKIYAGRNSPMVMESADNGLTWVLSNLTEGSTYGSFVDAAYKANGNYSFFIKSDRIFRSTNNGDSIETMAWLNINLPNFGIYKGFTCIEITDQGTILVGGRINSGYVHRSTNNMDSITEIEAMGIVHQEIYDIYQDATNKIWMGTHLGLLYSNDDGLTWAKDSIYPELKAYEIIENADGKVIVGGEFSNYMWNNNTWERISYGHGFPLKNLFLDTQTSILFAQGNHKTTTTNPELYTPIFSREESDFKDIELNFYPNPSSDFVLVDNKDSEAGEFIIFSSLGQEMLRQNFSADQNEIKLSILDYTPGVYFLVKKTKENAISKQLLVK